MTIGFVLGSSSCIQSDSTPSVCKSVLVLNAILLIIWAELRIMAKESKAAVIAISETWLDSSVINSEIQIEGYSILRNDRDRHRGGVCTHIINSIAFNTRTDLQTDGVESLWIQLLLPKTKLLL
jgi:hypothetical protein